MPAEPLHGTLAGLAGEGPSRQQLATGVSLEATFPIVQLAPGAESSRESKATEA